MLNNNKWSSLVSLIIWVIIISITILWISKMISYNINYINYYDEKIIIKNLKENTNRIINKIDTNWIIEWETFYVYKDNINKKIISFTWISNIEYMYIDKYWEKIDNISDYLWNIYSRELILKKVDNTIIQNNKIIDININKYFK